MVRELPSRIAPTVLAVLMVPVFFVVVIRLFPRRPAPGAGAAGRRVGGVPPAQAAAE